MGSGGRKVGLKVPVRVLQVEGEDKWEKTEVEEDRHPALTFGYCPEIRPSYIKAQRKHHF